MNLSKVTDLRFLPLGLRMVLGVLPLVWLWGVLINDLRVEWTVNPQYSYGWAMPFLCLYLIWRRSGATDGRGQPMIPVPLARRSQTPSAARLAAFLPFGQMENKVQILLFCFALLYAPIRMLEECNPDWRLVSWGLAFAVIGITLCTLRLAVPENCGQRIQDDGSNPLSGILFADLLFPICFFAAAVPWPTPLETASIQILTRADASAAAELLGWMGIPAMPHGNLIEVATGTVDIDEACSGIRSFQATLMISLFLGEYYWLCWLRRAGLVFAGFALSFAFNLCRMTLLTQIAATRGIAAIASWHDPAGLTILLASFLGIWGLAVWLKAGQSQRTSPGGKDEIRDERSTASNGVPKSPASDRKAAATVSKSPMATPSRIRLPSPIFLLAVWVLFAEVSIEIWYRVHEAHLPPAMQWTVDWPANNPSFKELPIPSRTRQILRYDEGRNAAWLQNGTGWQVLFLRWNPLSHALNLVRGHTPQTCMPATGRKVSVISELEWVLISGTPGHRTTSIVTEDAPSLGQPGMRPTEFGGANGLRLPFAIYEIMDASRTYYIFYCLWDDRAGRQGFETMKLTRVNRLAALFAGVRNTGQRSLEIAITGPRDPKAAGIILCAELGNLIQYQQPDAWR